MPSKTPKQERFMAAVANSPKFAKKVGVPQSVGKEFAKADKAKEDSEETFNGAVNDVLQRVDKDNITVEGIGVYTYDHLKANVKAKVKDLLERTEAGVHTGIGKTQLNVLAAMWQALVDYENSRD